MSNPTRWARFSCNDGRVGFGIFDDDRIIEYEGACGTSLGVGSIRDGAAVEVNIPGIGSLKNVLASSTYAAV